MRIRSIDGFEEQKGKQSGESESGIAQALSEPMPPQNGGFAKLFEFELLLAKQRGWIEGKNQEIGKRSGLCQWRECLKGAADLRKG